jgi:alpha-L-glutamate ligase-like protein
MASPDKILGMNARNLIYIRPNNLKPAVRLADDKLGHKKLLSKNGFPVPNVYGEFERPDQVQEFDWENLPNSFVIKPAMGFGGDGIVVVHAKTDEGWVRTDGSIIDIDQMKIHSLDILEGSYSMHSTPDTAFIEQKVITHPVFRKYTYKGTPDIRIIVFNEVPVMAMLRVPTEESDGRANLHAGALGIGVEIASGITTHAIYHGREVSRLPANQKVKLHGIKIPYWDDMLKMSSEIQKLTNIGYLGLDFVLDKEEGPMILEINARPGLSIQNANLAPLRDRLRRVKGLKIKNSTKAVRVAKELFGGEIEREVEEATGRPIVGFVEKVKIKGKKNNKVEVKAKVDTGAGFSSIERELARELGYGGVIKWFDSYELDEVMPKEIAKKFYLKLREDSRKIKKVADVALVHSSHGSSVRPVVKPKLTISGKTFYAKANISKREHMTYPVIIGRRDLKGFIVDPEKSFIRYGS